MAGDIRRDPGDEALAPRRNLRWLRVTTQVVESESTGAAARDEVAEATSSLPANFGRNVGANYALALTSIVIAGVTTPLLTRYLGPLRFGVWSLLGALIPYLELLELGLASAAVTVVAKALAVGDEDETRRAMSTAFLLLLVPGAAALGLAAGVTVVLPHLFSIPPPLLGQARILLLLLAVDMGVSIPGDTYGGGLIALQRFDLLAGSLLTVMVLQAVAWFVVLALGGNLVALGAATVGISLLGQLSRAVLFHRLRPGRAVSLRYFDRTLLSRLGRLSGWFMLRQLSGFVAGGIDVIIVGAVVGVEAAGVYAVGLRLASIAGNVVRPVVDVLFPHAANLTALGDQPRLRRSLMNGDRLALGVAAPVCLVLAVLAHPALRAWVGPDFTAATIVVVLLSAAAVVRSLPMTGSTLVSGSGDPKVPTLISTASGVLHIALCVVLGRIMGIEGVAIGTFAAAVLLDSAAMLVFVCRRFAIPLGRLVVAHVRAHLVPALAVVALGLYLSHGPLWSFVSGHGRIAGMAVVGATGLGLLVVYLAAFWQTGLAGDERRVALARLAERLGGRSGRGWSRAGTADGRRSVKQ